MGASLVRGPGCQLVVAMMCDADVCGLIPTTRLKRVFEMGRQTSAQGGTRFKMLRAQFWTLAQSKYISEGAQKWTLLGSKVVPPGGPVFGPFIVFRCAEALQAAMCASCQA